MKSRKEAGPSVNYGTLLKVFLMCSLIGGAGVGYVWQQQQVLALGKQMLTAERRLDDLRRQNDKLLRTWATLQSPRMLEEQVKKLNLGLGPPSPEQVMHINETTAAQPKAFPTNNREDRTLQTARLGGGN
jgi:hypothetical protein